MVFHILQKFVKVFVVHCEFCIIELEVKIKKDLLCVGAPLVLSMIMLQRRERVLVLYLPISSVEVMTLPFVPVSL